MRVWLLPILMVVLALLSLMLLKSVAPSLAAEQFVFLCLGALVFTITGLIPYSWYERWSSLGYLAVCILLVIPLAIGKTTRGIAGWIDIGTLFSIQPSQLAIPLVGLLISQQLSQHSPRSLWQLVKILGLILIPAGLILIEPDLGTTVIYLLALGTIVFISPVRWRYLAGMVGLAGVAMLIGWTFVLKPYQKERITSFVGDTTEITDANYNAQQALIAVGSGEVIGRGLGQGVQSHLRFLPERQTDFIFASLAEELGFIGSALVVSVYLMIGLLCMYVALRTVEPGGMYYSLAAAATMIFQSGVNIGMNMGLLPITGITLPLLSYGGSSIIATCLLLGIVHSLNQRLPAKSSFHLT
jgi:rod shape determining protein RodA